MAKESQKKALIPVDAPEAFINRELSWLAFARRVLAQAQSADLPLLERVKFAGIVGMLHDEFFTKRIGGVKRMINKGITRPSIDGRSPLQELMECREELLEQISLLTEVLQGELKPALAEAGIPILDYRDLAKPEREYFSIFFEKNIHPVLTPLAVDAEHPFPFISNFGLNLAVHIKESKSKGKRFVRIKVPGNLPRFLPLGSGQGFVPIEQVIAAHLDLIFPRASSITTYFFRVTRAMGDEDSEDEQGIDSLSDFEDFAPGGSIIDIVTNELKARRFAGATRLQVSSDMPEKMQAWLALQLGVGQEDIYPAEIMMGLRDLLELRVEGHSELRYPPHEPALHPRLRELSHGDTAGFFEEIRRGDILLHHPYHSFDSSVLRFLQVAAVDPQVLAIKLTIYRTNSDSPIVKALLEAARRGKQVAVLVEITASFDEAPNIQWGKMLEKEGAHVAYGVERLKTHVKLALVVRQEDDALRRYVHVGTGNYHTGTARIYEDLGLLSCDSELGADVTDAYNMLTSATPRTDFDKLLVAPVNMRERMLEMIQREAEHCRAGRPSGIRAKMNQLQDPEIIQELYRASQQGVPISLNVRGLCCLRPGVPGLSETISVGGAIGRFLEHSRIYRFENGGQPEFFIGSADWMRRNLDQRVETLARVDNQRLQRELDEILAVYDSDNSSMWDLASDGSYSRRRPRGSEEALAAQDEFIRRARAVAE